MVSDLSSQSGLNLNQVFESLASDFKLTRDEYLEGILDKIYPLEKGQEYVCFNFYQGEEDIFGNKVLIKKEDKVKSLAINSYSVAIIKFFEHINSKLEGNYELAYVKGENQDKTTPTLIDKTPKDMTKLKKLRTEPQVELYDGGLVTVSLEKLLITPHYNPPPYFLADMQLMIERGNKILRDFIQQPTYSGNQTLP